MNAAAEYAGTGTALSKPIRGAERVAVLLLAMGRERAGRLLQYFEPEDLRHITESAAELGRVSSGDVEGLVELFASEFSEGLRFLGTRAEVEELFEDVLAPEQIAAIRSGVGAPAEPDPEPVWERVSELDPERLTRFFGAEHPQTAALVASLIDPDVAAEALGGLASDLRKAIVRRMLTMGPVGEPSVRLVDAGVCAGLLAATSSGSGQGAHIRLAEIVNRMNQDAVNDILAGIAEAYPDDARKLKSLLFSFDDVDKLTPLDRQALFDKVPTDRVVLALQGAAAPLREAVLSALGARTRRMVESELANSAGAQDSDIAAARKRIAETALQLAAQGEIRLVADDPAAEEAGRAAGGEVAPAAAPAQ